MKTIKLSFVLACLSLFAIQASSFSKVVKSATTIKKPSPNIVIANPPSVLERGTARACVNTLTLQSPPAGPIVWTINGFNSTNCSGSSVAISGFPKYETSITFSLPTGALSVRLTITDSSTGSNSVYCFNTTSSCN